MDSDNKPLTLGERIKAIEAEKSRFYWTGASRLEWSSPSRPADFEVQIITACLQRLAAVVEDRLPQIDMALRRIARSLEKFESKNVPSTSPPPPKKRRKPRVKK